MTQLSKLKSARTLSNVADLLGFKASAVSYILYKKADSSKYKKFDIPKRFGGTRQIAAPFPELKLLQRRLSDLLQNCADEINQTNSYKNKISHGFKRKHSIISNAKAHRNRKYVFNVDLTNFFGSINFGRVRGFFIKDKNFALHPTVATVLAQIACYEDSLPQGSPCSPVISNLIGHVLDIHLVRLASQNGCTYSRYADDLSFSTNKTLFPRSIANKKNLNEHEWVPGNELTRLIEKSGFSLNPTKTRMQYCDSRQEVTGLVVNKKINIRCEYRRTVRAMVHHLFTRGSFELKHAIDSKCIEPPSKVSGSTKQLHGMLGFIDQVDMYNRKTTTEKLATKDANSKSSLMTKEAMYRSFLLFKEFFSATTPTLICEGKTDNVYLLHAIRSLAQNFPELATKQTDGGIKLLVRIFKYTSTSTGRILGLTGGTGELTKLLYLYDIEVKKFTAQGALHPVILLVDNDEGATEKGGVFSAIRALTKPKEFDRRKPFFHVTSNFYVVATPLKPEEQESKIEDFFDLETKSITLGGKSFLAENKFDTSKHYGKQIFAEQIVKSQANTIDFSKFDDILSNIVLAIKDHAKKQHSSAV